MSGCVLFPAGAGIRDAQVSRGLGYVYKSQGVISCVLARLLFGAKVFADYQCVTSLGVFTHHAGVVCIADIFGERIFDFSAFLCRHGGFMNPADPLSGSYTHRTLPTNTELYGSHV